MPAHRTDHGRTSDAGAHRADSATSEVARRGPGVITAEWHDARHSYPTPTSNGGSAPGGCRDSINESHGRGLPGVAYQPLCSLDAFTVSSTLSH